MRRWAERATAPFENWLWADMPRWAWFLILYLRPRPTLSCLREWFRQVTVLPGDEWDCVHRQAADRPRGQATPRHLRGRVVADDPPSARLARACSAGLRPRLRGLRTHAVRLVGPVTYEDAITRLAGCRAAQPGELQVIVSADIVDALLDGSSFSLDSQSGPANARCGRGLAMRGHGWITCAREHGHAGACSANT